MTDLEKLTHLHDTTYRSRQATLAALLDILGKDEPNVAYATTWKVAPACVAEHAWAIVVPAFRAVTDGRMEATEALRHLEDDCIRRLCRARVDGSTSTGDRLQEHAALQAAADILDRLR